MLSAFFELILAAAVWGFAFIAIVWTLPAMDPISINLVRFSVAGLLGLLIIFLKNPNTSRVEHFNHLRISFGPGLFLSLTLALQCWGLETTSVTNSGFITTTYVVMVPIIELIFFKERLPGLHWLWVALALVGTGLMIGLHLNQLNIGDLLTFLCAIAASLQIVWVGKIQKQIGSALLFNSYQCLWAGLGSLVMFPFYGKPYFNTPSSLAIYGLVFLAVVSSLFAFTLQTRAQRHLSASTASVIFLLESPFAAVFAFWILQESFGPEKFLGALLIFVAGVGSVSFGRRKPLH